MANLALIYPKISGEDFDYIQLIRKEYDIRYFDVVNPHITIVFGTDKLTADELCVHVGEKLSGYKSFSLNFDSAKVVEDDSGQFYHAFLVPSVGFDEINEIHDALYTGVLESELRHDIPFIPHIGVGAGAKEAMDKLVADISRQAVSITGYAVKVTIVQYDGKSVGNHSTVVLA